MPHFFDSTQEFLRSDQLWGHVRPPELDEFIGEVYKTSTHTGELRELTQDDVDNGIEPDTLVIKTVNNPDRNWNICKMDIPPERTGYFAAFMEGAEQSAANSGYLHVRAEKVANKFLPEKLEARGYHRVSRDDGNPNPDYVKDVTRAQ